MKQPKHRNRYQRGCIKTNKIIASSQVKKKTIVSSVVLTAAQKTKQGTSAAVSQTRSLKSTDKLACELTNDSGTPLGWRVTLFIVVTAKSAIEMQAHLK